MMAHLSHVMTLANGIIGVGVLAMPFCFEQCGIILATLVLLLSGVLSRLACHFLIKSAVVSRRRNFEFLAFDVFGRTGKFFVELFIVGFLLGTCVAFFVVVGDLAPQIIGKMLNKKAEDIRTSILATTGAFIVFPLGLLRNIDSLSGVCTATIAFYLCLVVKVIAEATRHIFLGDWYGRVMYWRPGGILRCLPIFAMALFCQTQLFEIYDAIPNVCLDKMNQVVRGALNICTAVYLCVGFFGYVAFCAQPFTGNILMSFEPSLTSDLIKMGFVFSVAFSFPLVIFPCRASLNSLLFRRAHAHEPSNYYIPEMRFRCLTLTIVAMSLGTGILIPNIEFVLGIVGSTIGVAICLIFPAAFFIAISTKNTNERLVAQAILVIGVSIMILGTYANLYAMDEPSISRISSTTDDEPIDRINDASTFDKIQLLNEQLPLDGDAKILQKYKEKNDNSGREILTLGNGVKGTAGDEAFVVGETKEADDRRRNDNLIDSDAIKKEESELAAAAVGDQTDVEKLRRTLERHKLEQLEMMQEQKEILKDIKEMEDKQRSEKRQKDSETIVAVNADDKARDRFSGAKIFSKGNKETRNESIVDDILPNDEKIPKKINTSGNAVLVESIAHPKESHGPILNALTNGTSEKNKRVAEAEIAKKPIEYALPIALQMRNRTNAVVDDKLSSNNSAKRNESPIRREILGDAGDRRDKRDIDDEENLSKRNRETNDEPEETPFVDECQRKIKESTIETINNIPADFEAIDKKISSETNNDDADGRSHVTMLKKKNFEAPSGEDSMR